MSFNIAPDDLETLREGFRRQEITMFLGAGVSVASGLPTWEKLILSVYFAAISERKLGSWRPFPNYLYAISDWYLQERQEPLEITARKLRLLFDKGEDGQRDFLRAVRDALYRIENSDLAFSEPPDVSQNQTLQAVAAYCALPHASTPGVKSVVTYNYDDLLERALEGKRDAQPVFDECAPVPGELPVYHVHGYIPFPSADQPEPSGVVLSEEEYNQAASDPYSWSNLVQLREMSGSVGVMVGLSLADRNIRRLLDALAKSPVQARIFALLKRPSRVSPDQDAVDRIDQDARAILNRFAQAGIKSRAMSEVAVGYERMAVKSEQRYAREIRGIVEAVDDLAQEQETRVLERLGITPIWYDDHAEIGEILRSLSNA